MTKEATSPALEQARAAYDAFRARGLKLDIQRGQPSDADFDLSNGLLTALGEGDLKMDGLDLRNYPGGVTGLPSARSLFARYLDLKAENVVVWNNSSLELQGLVLTFALLHGVRGSSGPWITQRPKMIVTVPGYDRHFLLLETLGFELLTVDMQPDGPDVEAIERLAAGDPTVKGVLFVPTYSNPGGESISAGKARRLAGVRAAAPDFTIFADDAYRAHHLSYSGGPGERDEPVNFVALCRDAGFPDRAFVFASTSKITFASAGLGFVGTSEDNVKWLSKYLNAQSIGPNKVEQARHVRFLDAFPGGLEGLMGQHARLLAPRFRAVDEVLRAELGEGGEYARWKVPRGGYFISLDTAEPVAARVVELANAAGVSLTPAGATYPGGQDPTGRNIRLAPTRPPVEEVTLAMQGVAACVRLATEEYRSGREG